MKAYVPALYASLGLFIPLIVVNCIVLGRAESFAAKHNAFDSMLDGVGIGLGFTGALTLLGAVREFLGTGKIFSVTIFPEQYGALVFVLARRELSSCWDISFSLLTNLKPNKR